MPVGLIYETPHPHPNTWLRDAPQDPSRSEGRWGEATRASVAAGPLTRAGAVCKRAALLLSEARRKPPWFGGLLTFRHFFARDAKHDSFFSLASLVAEIAVALQYLMLCFAATGDPIVVRTSESAVLLVPKDLLQEVTNAQVWQIEVLHTF